MGENWDLPLAEIMGQDYTPPPRRKIWLWSAPGSGAPNNLGPSHDLGERCASELGINHVPLVFPIGGYMGLMGGDPTFSYNDVVFAQYQNLLWQLDNNPDVQEAMRLRAVDPHAKVEFEGWFSGYSQSADGMEDAVEILFGDGGFVIPKTGETVGPGKYRILRDRINGLVQFGNPSTKTTGIARKVRPDWLYALVRNNNYANDFYAVAPDEIRPAFYAIIVEANISLPFFTHVLNIAGPVILGWAAFLGPFAPLALAAGVGLSTFAPLLGGLMGGTPLPGDIAVDKKLEAELTASGLLTDLPALIQVIAALPGLQAHGNYPFDQQKMDEAYGVIASFHR